MSRFSNLEFPQGGEEAGSSTGRVRKDEGYYLAEAQKAFEREEFDLALRRFSRALEENPRSRPAWIGQLRMMIELGDFGEAAAWADRGLEILPRDADLMAAKAVALVREGNEDEALALSDASFESGPTTPYLWLARGEVLLRRGDRNGDDCLAEAVSLAPEDWRLAWLAARIRMGHGLYAAALRSLQQAIARDAGPFVLWLHRGECEAALGFREAAEISFRQALELNSECQAARVGLGSLANAGVIGRAAGIWRRIKGR